jgi:hypothetical protein
MISFLKQEECRYMPFLNERRFLHGFDNISMMKIEEDCA